MCPAMRQLILLRLGKYLMEIPRVLRKAMVRTVLRPGRMVLQMTLQRGRTATECLTVLRCCPV